MRNLGYSLLATALSTEAGAQPPGFTARTHARQQLYYAKWFELKRTSSFVKKASECWHKIFNSRHSNYRLKIKTSVKFPIVATSSKNVEMQNTSFFIVYLERKTERKRERKKNYRQR